MLPPYKFWVKKCPKNFSFFPPLFPPLSSLVAPKGPMNRGGREGSYCYLICSNGLFSFPWKKEERTKSQDKKKPFLKFCQFIRRAWFPTLSHIFPPILSLLSHVCMKEKNFSSPPFLRGKKRHFFPGKEKFAYIKSRGTPPPLRLYRERQYCHNISLLERRRTVWERGGGKIKVPSIFFWVGEWGTLASYGKGTDVLKKKRGGRRHRFDNSFDLQDFSLLFAGIPADQTQPKHLLDIGFVEFPLISLSLSYWPTDQSMHDVRTYSSSFHVCVSYMAWLIMAFLLLVYSAWMD